MATRVYVPRETSAVSIGADDVALAIARQAKQDGEVIELVRNGSWGATWLEPLVEVEVDGARVAYNNVEVDDVASLFASGFLQGREHDKRLGPINEVPYLIDQDRWTFFRCGLIDPVSVEDFRERSGFAALEKAFETGPDAVVDAVLESYLDFIDQNH